MLLVSIAFFLCMPLSFKAEEDYFEEGDVIVKRHHLFVNKEFLPIVPDFIVPLPDLDNKNNPDKNDKKDKDDNDKKNKDNEKKKPDNKINGEDKKPVDCYELLQMNKTQNGEYKIYPKNRKNEVVETDVYCDMETDEGGWTVIQRRGSYPEETNFYRSWKEYRDGFGNVSKDFWLGNENIYALTTQGVYTLRVDMKSGSDSNRFVQYGTFWIGDEHSNYALHLSDYGGTATDDMTNQNNMMFSTYDRPNDRKLDGLQCPVLHRGGWWYPLIGCGFANLNGVYMNGVYNEKSNWWYNWSGFKGLEFSEMKVRPRYSHR